MKIVITLDVPDGTSVSAENIRATYAHPTEPSEPVYTPPFADELIPLPDAAIPLPEDATARQLMAQAVNTPPGFAEGAAIAQVTPFRGMATGPVPGFCPVHGKPWKLVPAGVSKRTGKAYDAFSACPERGCTQRPAA